MTKRLRLGSGLVLFTYVTLHLTNHALGMDSLETAESARLWFLALWRFPPLTALLYGSLILHILLAYWALYQRRHLRMPTWELVRTLLGFAIPVLIIDHIFRT